MKKNNFYSLIAAGMLLGGIVAVSSCQKDAAVLQDTELSTAADQQRYSLNFGLSEQLGNKELTAAKAIFTNIATGATHVVQANSDGTVSAELPQAVYEVEISGYIPELVDGRTKNRRVSAVQQLGPTFRSATAQPLALTLSANPLADFKIEQLYNSASASGIRDQFVKITNTSGVTLEADGLFFAEAGLLNVNDRTYTPEIRDTAFAAFSIWRVPMEELKDVAAGASIVFVNQAQNHTGGLNLNNTAYYEWFNPSATNDIDNTSVPNLEKIFCYSPNIWVIQQAGNRSYAIGYLPMDGTAYLAAYKYSPTYLNSAGNPVTVNNTYAIPNSWISDGINIAPSATWEQNMLHSSIDAGYTGINSPYYGRSHQRKKVGGVLVDTNDSGSDFTYGGSTVVTP